MARFIDESPEYQPEDGEALANFDDEEQIPEEEQPVEPEEIQEAQEDPIPEKYQGKDIKDIVRMHQEAEKLLGKQSSEVGELRGIVDTFVKTQLEKANSPQQQEDVDDDIDFFDDPKKAVEAAIAKHPKIKEAEQLSSYMKQQAALNKLHSDHPDFNDIIQDNNFQEWVMASQVRQELYQRADQNFDYASANELLKKVQRCTKQIVSVSLSQLQQETLKDLVRSLVVKSIVVLILLNLCKQTQIGINKWLLKLGKPMPRVELNSLGDIYNGKLNPRK
jgi:hypothetical protein